MVFEIDRQFNYNKDILNSRIIGDKPTNLPTMNTANNEINILISREENHLNLHEL